MNLKALPAIFEEIAGLLEIKGENPFKIRAYQNAAKVLSQIEDLEKIIKEKRLKDINGIGEAISKKIEEYYKSGIIQFHEELKKQIPVSLIELMKVPNLGPRKIKVLYEKLGITNIGELEYACKENRLLTLFGFGKKTQDRILSGIEFFKKHKDEFLLVHAESEAETLKETLKSRFPQAKIEICGSIRRKKEIVKDIDVLLAGESEKTVKEYMSSLPQNEKILLQDDDVTVIKLRSGINAEVRTVREEEYPYALLYLTGSREHVSALSVLYKKRGVTLSDHGPISKEKSIRFGTEDEIYRFLGLDFIPPELREGCGEIEAAASGNLPELVRLEDLKGIFHVHTDFSDGIDSIEALVGFSKRMGFEYMGISDHSRSAYYARGLKIDDLERQWNLIDEINRKEENFYVFKGIEADILPDGSLDYPPEILSRFDFVIASIHSHFKLEKKAQMERIIKALKNPYVTIFGHPTGRLLLSREGYEVDMETIIEISKENRVVIELNASPYRLDIDWRHLRLAKQKGVLVSINPDAHSLTGILDTVFGVSMARKGWLEKKDILNTKTVDEIKDFFRSKKEVTA